MIGKNSLSINVFRNDISTCRILVLEAGRVVEFGGPRDLLEKKGNFYGMAKDAGLV